MWKENKAAESLREDLSRLRIRIDELESQAKISKLEGAELYDKTLRLMQRMAQRYNVDKKEALTVDEPEETEPGVIGADTISQSILRRRARGLIAK